MSGAAELAVEEAEEKDFLAGYNDPVFKPSGEQTDAEKADAEKAAAEKAESDRVAAAQAAGDQTDAEKAAAEKAESDRVAAAQAAGDQTDAEKAAAEKAESDRVAAAQAESEKPYRPDYAKLLQETADEIKRDNRDAISRITKKQETRTPDEPNLETTSVAVAKALEGLSDDQIKQTLQKVRDTDPETADAVEGLFSKVTGTVGSLAKAVDTMRVTRESDQAKAEEDAKVAATAQVETTIAAKHPDFRAIVGSFDGKTPPSAEFTEWFNKQPGYLQETARTTADPNVFVSILDKYSADSKPEQTAEEKAAAEKAESDRVAAAQAAGEQTDAEKAIEEARRAGARQPRTKAHAERKAKGQEGLSDDDEWMKGYEDPEFDKK